MFRFAHTASPVYGFCAVSLLSYLLGETLWAAEPLARRPQAGVNRQVDGGTAVTDRGTASPSQDAGSIPTHATALAADGVKQAAHEERPSDAERIADLRRAIEADQQAVESIEAELANPESEYHRAEAEFGQLDTRLKELQKASQEARDAPAHDDELRLNSEIEKLQPQWKLAKDRFDLAIRERKTIQEKAATLKLKIQQEQQILDKLSGAVPPAPPASESRLAEQTRSVSDAAAPAPDGSIAPIVPQPAPATSPARTAATDTAAAASQDVVNFAPTVSTAQAPLTPITTSETTTSTRPSTTPTSKALAKATEEAGLKETIAQEAEKQVESVAERMALLQKHINLEQQLLATTRKKADIALETERQLQQDYQNRLCEDAEPDVLDDLRRKVTQAQQRFSEARAESRARVNRLQELQTRYAALQSEQISALQEAERTRSEAESAMRTVAALRNPFTLRNILQWLIDHGPRIAVILVTMLIALRMIRVAERRIVDMMVKRGGLEKLAERERRAQTLVGVFQNAAKVAIVSGGGLMVLDAVGAPVTALMGGAAVFGLAIAFGAQSLIKDYFYGFMILLEQQYTINDVVKIGDTAGQVERITLRMTVLRDLEGRVHFIPHGTITSTTNMTHGWSRAMFEIGIAYKEDTDRVIALIQQVGKELGQDPHFAPLILEELTMLGVDAFGDSAVVIKFFIKTRPLKQWEVKRELLRRIKKTFDAQGVEIPFPHRTVYHRHAGAENVEILSDDQRWRHRASA